MTQELVPTNSTSIPVDVAIADWLYAKHGKSGSERTLTAYRVTLGAFRSVLQRNGVDLFDDRTIGLSTVLGRWASGRYRNGELVAGTVAPATYNLRIAIVGSFYEYARKRNLVTSNPVDVVDRRTVEEYGRATALTPANVREGLQAIDRSTLTGLRDYALLSVALSTGRRLSEITAWRWGNVKQSGEGVTLTTPKAKGGKVASDELQLPIARALLAWLHAHYGERLEHLSPAAALWVNLSRAAAGPDLPISQRMIADIVLARLGTHPHALRHTFAHSMEAVGAPVSAIQQRLGHSSLATTGKYLTALKRSENPHAAAVVALLLGEE